MIKKIYLFFIVIILSLFILPHSDSVLQEYTQCCDQDQLEYHQVGNFHDLVIYNQDQILNNLSENNTSTYRVQMFNRISILSFWIKKITDQKLENLKEQQEDRYVANAEALKKQAGYYL